MNRSDLLISTEQLAARLGDARLRVIDLRWSLDGPDCGEPEYLESHVPGAIYLHLYRDLSDPDDPVQGQLARPERFCQTMARAGIRDDTLVVAYDNNQIFTAARLVWSLHVYGYRNVRILDGGFPKWSAEGRPVSAGPESPPASPGRFTPHFQPHLRATKEQVLALAGRDDRLVLDCRMDMTWNDAGAHIPGARRFPAPRLLTHAGVWRPTAELAQLAAAAGVSPGQPVLLYCGGGISAACSYVALTMAGCRDLTVYDGSWSEWSTDPDTPKEQHANEPRC